ncbi:MAG: DUF6485 family protein [Candidatus Nealsonbacteria bacterium]
MECQKDKNSIDCKCTYLGCPRKGICCECLRHHLESDELPACYFSTETEKTFDRSIERFIKDRNIKN